MTEHIKLRRLLHSQPELAGREETTSQFIQTFLKRLGGQSFMMGFLVPSGKRSSHHEWWATGPSLMSSIVLGAIILLAFLCDLGNI